MTSRFTNPVPQFLDSAGDPILGGEINFYENGTLIRKDTYADVNKTILNANPLPLTADARVPNVYYDGTARVIVTFTTGQLFDKDGVGDSGSGAAFVIWTSLVEYEDGALVEGSDGEYYRSLQANNLGNDPTASPTFWEKVSFLRTWNANITYALGDGGVVGSDGKIYASLQASNLNKDPISEPTWWAINNPFNQSLDTTDDVGFNDLAIAGIGSFATGSSVDPDAVALRVFTGNVADGGGFGVGGVGGKGDTIGRTWAIGHSSGSLLYAVGDSTADNTLSQYKKVIMRALPRPYYNNGIELGGEAATNLLDDFEEDGYIAALTCGVGTITLDGTKDTLHYTKVGNKVTITGQVTVSAISTPSTVLRLSLPFAVASLTEDQDISSGSITYNTLGVAIGAAGALTMVTFGSGSVIGIVEQTTTGYTDNEANHIGVGTTLAFDFTYIAA